MQLVKCTACGAELVRLDAATKQVYEIDESDRKPKNKKDHKPKPPAFHLRDRKQKKVKDKDWVEVAVEEPMTITCACGYPNLIY